MTTELLTRVKEDDVKFICLQFTDVNGIVKSVDIPAQRLDYALENGIWFDGSSVEGFARIQESDMRLMPDADTYAVLPWSQPERRRARFFCDIYSTNGQPFPGSPRGVLKRMLKTIEEKGWKFNIGPEPEFFLLKKNESDQIHPLPHDVGGYFDFSARDDAQRVRAELMLAISQMGLDVEMGHHEVARGQHEIDFHFEDALKAADSVLTLKYTVKAIAAQFGITATFMPKPIYGISGSGMHCHQSISDAQGRNLFYEENDPYHLSKLAYGFIAGQLEHARALSAIVAPTVNSYKRIVPGYEAPVYICWAQVNRSAMIRIPHVLPGRSESARAELRFPDPTCNPYLAFAAMLAVGLDGVEKGLDCPEPVNNVNIYELDDDELAKRGVTQLPLSLGEALQEIEKDDVIKDALGDEAYAAFMRAKQAEWKDYNTQVTDWEIKQYMELY